MHLSSGVGAPFPLHHGLFIEQQRTVRYAILASQPTYGQEEMESESPVRIKKPSGDKEGLLRDTTLP